MRLFDEVPRFSLDAMREDQSVFEYYNHSARPFVIAMRNLMETWFAAYPEGDGKAELRERFRGADNAQHYGAIFELFVHALLKGMGYDVEIHPDIAGSSRHPDFLVKRAGERLFYAEATIADPSDHSQKRERGLIRLKQAIDKVPSPDLYVDADVEHAGSQDVSFKPLIRAVTRWIQAIDLGQAQRGEAAAFAWKRDGWEMKLTARGKPEKRRGQLGRTRGVVARPVVILDTSKRITNSVKAKAGRYGKLDLPLVVAVNVMDGALDDIDIMEGLFGTETFTYQVSDAGIEATMTGRAPDGALFGHQGLQNRRVSAVMVCDRMSPGDVHSRRTVLVHHPRAYLPLPPELWPLPQLKPNPARSVMEPRPGKTAGELLGVPLPWPPTTD